MNRTDRLLAIILELQAKRHQRAEDLAATFETSKRTIYRDVQALAEAGVPLVSTPGKGYALIEGYFLPPVRFTVDEATTLLLGSDLMTQTFDADYRTAAQVAGRKIEALLPAAQQSQVAELRERIQFVSVRANEKAGESATLRIIRQAILTATVIHFRYQARQAEAETSRDVSPYSLTYVSDTWQLTGYCHLRQDMRVFRVSRLADLRVLSRRFDRAEHLTLWQQTQARMGQPKHPEVAILWFDAESARWVREDPFFYVAERQPTPDGLRITLRAPDEQAVVQWILGWGSHVRAIEPESLRARLLAEVEAMRRHWEQQ